MAEILPFPPRPTRPATPHENTIPKELKDRPQWVLWTYALPEGRNKWTKKPRSVSGGAASSTDPATWATYNDCCCAYVDGNYDGIGSVFAPDDPYCGIDLDNALEADGTPKKWAKAILDDLNSYAEVSPSGLGVKVWVRAKLPAKGRRVTHHDGEIEIYDKGRYFTVTGCRVPGTPAEIRDAQIAVNRLLDELGLTAQPKPAPPPKAPPDFTQSDAEIINRAKESKNGAKFSALWSGSTAEYGGDDSRADLALVSLLAFWTCGDRSRIDSLFRLSGLYRSKWDERHGEKTYGQMTIDKAMEGRTDFYKPPGSNSRHYHDPSESPPNGTDPPETASLPPREIHLTDVGNGYRFARMHRERAVYVEPWNRWYRWVGTGWKPDDLNAADRMAKDVVREMFGESRSQVDQLGRELGAIAEDPSNADDRERVKRQLATAEGQVKWAFKSESASRIAAMLRLAESELAATPEMFDCNPWAFNCQNGTIDLRTTELRAHRPADYITKICPLAFDSAATCPQWEQFLATIFPPAVASYMRRFIGYCLTGDVREQILTFFYGDGSNGKSTLLEVIQSVLGKDYSSPAPEGLLMARKDVHPTEIADLFGKRLVSATETREGGRLDEERVKRLTGGDKLKGRRNYENFFEFDPTHKLIVCTNHRPRIVNQDLGIWRRVRMVPFEVCFWDPDKATKNGEERDPQFRADKDIKTKLLAESTGILAWAVRGCQEWLEDGLCPPPEVDAATEAYRADQDTLADFLVERCNTENPESRIRTSILYSQYCEWMEKTGERSKLGRKTFSQQVQRKGFKIIDSHTKFFCGIELRQSLENELF